MSGFAIAGFEEAGETWSVAAALACPSQVVPDGLALRGQGMQYGKVLASFGQRILHVAGH